MKQREISFVRCDRTPAWQALGQHHAAAGRSLDLRQAFAADPQRFHRFSQRAPHVLADMSKNLIDPATEDLLLQLARQCGVAAQRDAMFAGQAINHTEDRPVLHVMLRQPRNAPVSPQLAPALKEVHAVLDELMAHARLVRGDAAITDVVTIGIGGSHLGPEMAIQALRAYDDSGKRFHFVSNVDGHELQRVLNGLSPRSTLFIVASKTFTTAETMTNARSARRWFEQQLGLVDGQHTRDLVARHFWGLTTNLEAAREFGIATTFGFRDWVGGRYSLMSSIGAPLAIAIGPEAFGRMLAGAHAMDEHFRTAPLACNLPVRLGLLDVWYRNFHGFASRNVAAYHSDLGRWPAYLQQLEMESNGKRVDRAGQALPYDTAPVVWGETGTNGQHAYFQMLHQGTQVTPVEFLAVREASHDLQEHHPRLLANALAQAQALMQGRVDEGGHQHFTGNRPSTFLLLERLDPESLGALVALYEHRVFVAGAVWGINSFDQWGVELGKTLAVNLEACLSGGATAGLDASTAGLVEALRHGVSPASQEPAQDPLPAILPAPMPASLPVHRIRPQPRAQFTESLRSRHKGQGGAACNTGHALTSHPFATPGQNLVAAVPVGTPVLSGTGRLRRRWRRLQ